jgi:hypothetical protein
MAIHLIKLSVGPETLSDLTSWQTQRLKDMQRCGKKPELMHVTRHTPKRAEELLSGGSIYWVIKGWICARQKLLEFRPLVEGGVAHCGIILEPEMIRVIPRAHRPFQGWRYLDPKAAPSDIAKNSGIDDMPEDMRRELAELGLL